jgi:hypothetical protein
MSLAVTLIVQVGYFFLNLAIAKYQAHRFDTNQKRINHTVWLIYYCAACAVVWFPWRNWYLVSSVALMHLPVFNTALNYYRKPRRPLFYTHPEDPHGSKIDKLWGESYPAVFFLVLIAYITVIFYI